METNSILKTTQFLPGSQARPFGKIVPWELWETKPRTLKKGGRYTWKEISLTSNFQVSIQAILWTTLPETNIFAPESRFRWKTFSFPFGFRPIFRCENFSFSEGNCFFPPWISPLPHPCLLTEGDSILEFREPLRVLRRPNHGRCRD